MAALYEYRLVSDGKPPVDGDRGGVTYVAQEDFVRLNRQQRRVFDVMQDGRWRTLHDIAVLTGDPEASVSARLRDFRKPGFGGSTVERRPAYRSE